MDRKNYIGFKKSCVLLTLCSLLLAFFAASTFAADKLVVKDANGNTKFLVTDIGRVGIGTTNPLGNIHEVVDGDHSWFYQDAYGEGKVTVMQFRAARGSLASPTIVHKDDLIFDIRGQAWDGAGDYFKNVAIIRMAVDGTPGSYNMPGRIQFFTTAAGGTTVYERMRINNAGNVGIGESNPQHLLHLKNGAYSDGYTWETASSREYKENIKDLTKGEALLALNKLNPVTFNYKTDQEKNHVGFIAEDVPDLVASKDRKGLSPMDIIAVLTKVLQEQQKKISYLSEKVTRLEKLIK